jgi:hypothetical protein
MSAIRTACLASVVLLAATGASHAGRCAKQIDAMQGRVDAWLEMAAARGPAARETTAARLHRQPTVRSIERAEERLGDVPPRTVSADASDNLTACRRALRGVGRLLRP